MRLADVYDALNNFVGRPTHVEMESYTRTDLEFQQHTLPLLEEISIHAAPDARVLIIGCGDEVEIEWFAGRCASVVAVDIARSAVERA